MVNYRSQDLLAPTQYASVTRLRLSAGYGRLYCSFVPSLLATHTASGESCGGGLGMGLILLCGWSQCCLGIYSLRSTSILVAFHTHHNALKTLLDWYVNTCYFCLVLVDFLLTSEGD